MTAPPDVIVHHGAPWFAVPTTGAPDLEAWAGDAARAAWSSVQIEPTAAQVDWLAAMFEASVGIVAPRTAIGAFALVPEPATGITAMATVTAIELDDDYSPDALLDGMTFDSADLVSTPSRGELDTPAGTAYWLRQRSAGTAGGVLETTQYAWVFPAQRAMLVLGATFTDLLEAKRWEATLDWLANGMTLESADL